ncbi:Serine protease Do, related [Eimeria brunetti]|uniref:Serine protease Do, related n=1 Tax=Eimeria brunetti TaxID=51314 RepID=U6LQK4_9EIME|nr:Serine protease Do, related [Eimeria brunetti]
MISQAYPPISTAVSAAFRSLSLTRWPGRYGHIRAFVRRRVQHVEQALELVSPNYGLAAKGVGTPVWGASLSALWLCVGTIAAAGACNYIRDNWNQHRHQHIQLHRGKADARGQCADDLFTDSILSSILHCEERGPSGAATAVAFRSSAPGAFSVGAPALCKELPKQQQQHDEREQHRLTQPLKLQQIFEMMKPLVVRVYAVLRTQTYSGRRAVDQTEVNDDKHVHEQLNFLGSGFFFDDQDLSWVEYTGLLCAVADISAGHIVTAAHVVLRPSKMGMDAVICPKTHEPRGRLEGNFEPFSFAVKDSSGLMHVVHLCGVDETTDVAVLRMDDSFQRRGLPHAHGKFAVACPAMGEIIATYAATEHANEPVGVTGQVVQPRQTFKAVDDSGSMSLLQMQLLTLPGMSGAPVFNMEGSIVGMLVKKFDMCGLALPSTVLLRVAQSLRDSGKFTVPSIGLLLAEETPRLAATHPSLPTRSVLRVCGVVPGSAADEAGVREGDRIIEVKGEVMDSIGRNEDTIANIMECEVRL